MRQPVVLEELRDFLLEFRGHGYAMNQRDRWTIIAGRIRDDDETKGILIRVNDMSLPLGGLFDIDNNWRPDHRAHRTGIHADVAFTGVRQGVCASYDRELLRFVIREVTGKWPVIESDHFHVFAPQPPLRR